MDDAIQKSFQERLSSTPVRKAVLVLDGIFQEVHTYSIFLTDFCPLVSCLFHDN